MNLLEIIKLDHYFGGLHAVNNISFCVEEGAIKAVIGPNGAGKTTIFNLIAGTYRPRGGEVLFSGSSIFALPPFQVAERGIARTFQNIKLFYGMTVLENIMVGCHTRSRAGFIAGMFNLPWTWKEEKHIREKALEILEDLDLGAYHDWHAENLSFGKQRAVELARALAGAPQLLLLDEPAAGLNIHETAEIAGLISRIRDMGVTILLVEHDMSLVMDISDEIFVLNYGKPVAEGTPAEIRKNQDVIDIYLGED